MSELTDKELLDELQNRLKKKNDLMKDLQQMKENLASVNQRLEESEAMKSHFISNITNDIINPFSSILGLTRHLKNMQPSEYEQMQKFAQMIHEEAFDLDFHLKNIFAAAKLEAGEYHPVITQTKVIDLVKQLIDHYRMMSQRKNLKLLFEYTNTSSIREQDYFKTDSDKLQIIVANLINNAIRVTPENGTVNIDLTLTNTTLKLRVHDEGKGVHVAHTSRIFDRFYRIDRAIHSENKGLGLGLAVSKGILDLLEGSIRLQNEQSGSQFTVELPEDRTEELVTDVSARNNETIFDDEDVIF